MAAPRRKLIAGNWKMNGVRASMGEFGKIVAGAASLRGRIDIMVCPPATLIGCFVKAAAGAVAIGGQNCHAQPFGAFTGDISAEMLADLGATAVIAGHSERRRWHHESDADVRRKVEAAWRARLTAICCVGESGEEHRAGDTLAVVRHQLDGSIPNGATSGNLVVAYEPVWAIGSGHTPTTADVAAVHGMIREDLDARLGAAAGQGIRILYGGSVTPANAPDLLGIANVDGALVGGASLKAEEFLAIAGACR
jgi:triosephosphate isomerase (TIM)